MNKGERRVVPSITIQPDLAIERVLTLEIVRVTERAAVSAARLRGRGNEKAADQAAVDAMRRELNKLPIDGTVVIGEGELDEAPMLFIGEKVGNKSGPKVDIAVDPLEGTNLCAKNMPGAIATLAIAAEARRNIAKLLLQQFHILRAAVRIAHRVEIKLESGESDAVQEFDHHLDHFSVNRRRL